MSLWPQLTFLEKLVLSFLSLSSKLASVCKLHRAAVKAPLTPEPVGTWEFQDEHVGPQRPLFHCKKSFTTKDEGEAGGGARNGLGQEGMRDLASSQQPSRTAWDFLIRNRSGSPVHTLDARTSGTTVCEDAQSRSPAALPALLALQGPTFFSERPRSD